MGTQGILLAEDTVLVFLKDSFIRATVSTINQRLCLVVVRDPVDFWR